MKDVRTRWAVYDEALKIWYDGELVAQIPPSEFKFLLADLAEHLKWQETEKTKAQ